VTGTYALTVSMSSSGDPICNNGICFSAGLCINVGEPPSMRAVTTAVHLERSGDTISIRPEDPSASFRMELHVEANALSGTASGQFRDGNVQLSVVSGQGQSAAAVTGTVQAASVAGKIDGQVGLGGYSCSSNGHTWNLVPR
jgi:hypothetical protein